ncbi:MAG: DNA-binding protein, partial [Achromobacter sp.]|nr:DNA-binding protein [Achromobacter sp.]
RLFDAGYVSQTALWQHYREELDRLHTLTERRGGGRGHFYRSLGARTSKRFARAIVSSTLEGLTSFPDAFRMLGVRKTATFYKTARELGVAE